MYTKQSICRLLQTSSLCDECHSGLSGVEIERGVLALYELQALGQSSTALSGFALEIQRKQDQGIKLGYCLSHGQLQVARRQVIRHADQLVEVANRNLAKAA